MTDLSDIYGALIQQHAASNPYTQFGSTLGTAGAAVKTDNPWANLATGIVSGLIGGGLGAYGQFQEREYQNAALENLTALSLGAPTTIGDHFGSEDLSQLTNLFSLKQAQAAQDQAALLGKLKNEAIGARLKAAGEVVGKAEGEQVAYGEDAGLLNPIEKETRARGKEDLAAYNTTRDYLAKEGSDLKGIEQAYGTIQKNIAIDTPAAKLSVFNALAKLDDPTGAITAGSFEAAKQALPALQKTYGGLALMFGDDQPLSADTKKAILEAATNRANVFVSQYNPLAEREATKLSQFKLDPKLAGAEPKPLYQIETAPVTTGTIDKATLDATTAALMQKHGGDTVKVKAELLTQFPGVFTSGH